MADWQQKGLLKWSQVVPAIILLVGAWSIATEQPIPAQMVKEWTFDLYQRLQPPAGNPQAPKVVVVDLDAKSRAELNQWPWPRTRLANLVTKLNGAGADLILLDAVFDTKDQTSPDQMLETWWTTPGIDQAIGSISQLPDHDALFANALSSARVISAFELNREPASDEAGGEADRPLIKSDFALPDAAGQLGLAPFSGATSTIAPLSSITRGNGSRNIQLSRDGRARTLGLIGYYDGRVYPHQVLEGLRLFKNESLYTVSQKSDSFGTYLTSINVGDVSVPISRSGALYLYANTDSPLTQLSASDVLSETADLSIVQDTIVFLSMSADAQSRMVINAQGRTLSEGVLKAEALQQILNQDFLVRPEPTRWAETAFTIVISLAILLLMYWRPLWSVALWITSAGIGGYTVWRLFTAEKILVDAGMPLATTLLVCLSSAAILGLQNAARKTYFRSAFGANLSSGTVTALANDPSGPATKGMERSATVMVCGLRGMADVEANYRKHPEELGRIINDFMTDMTAHVHAANGTVNRYLGDHFIAAWNAPLEDRDHALHAVDCALKMLDSLDRLNQKLENAAGQLGIRYTQLEMGIGLSTGPCIAGMMGFKRHEEYSVIGEVTRRAGRLFRTSQSYGPAVIVSETTYVQVHHAYALLEIDYIERSDSDQPERIFALMGNPVMKANPKFRDLEKSHQAFFTALQAQDWESALDVIRDARGLSGAMPRLYDIYEKRIQDYIHNPPDERWIGAHQHSDI